MQSVATMPFNNDYDCTKVENRHFDRECFNYNNLERLSMQISH